MRILFIRGGALGDLIVTLPTVRAVRAQWPEAHIEWLGHPHLAEIAHRRHYLDEVRSVQRRPMAAFFMPQAVLDPDWMDYFSEFDLVFSYYYDPDELFLTNLRRCGPPQIITGLPQVPKNFAAPAAIHFASVLTPLGLELEKTASQVHPSPEDDAAAAAFLSGLPVGTRLAALHPGSGSETKNWPLARWSELGRRLVAEQGVTLLLIEGEADGAQAQVLAEAWKDLPVVRARLLPLPMLAALLRRAAFYVGHDSGVTHLAAAVREDLPVITLFGPTNPLVWAPPRPAVTVVKKGENLTVISVEDVLAEVEKLKK